MANKRCCFAGHSSFYDVTIAARLKETITKLIEEEQVYEFWVGNYGKFDSYAVSALQECKQLYPQIKLELIIPYLTKDIELYKEYYYKKYDHILISEIPNNTPAKFKIIKNNEYMVRACDYLICYVKHTYGGAYKTLTYAKRKSKTVINLAPFD
ncbi:MAG: DUF1273 family protein [Clostridia bacterium]|nr:DUF1273 family protein [Clostridia bacterium]